MSRKPNPFNPTLPARPEEFVGRKTELAHFASRLGSTVSGSAMSMAIVGNRGMGKTSFLAKCEKIAEEKGCVVVRFSAIDGEMVGIESLCTIILAEIEGELRKKSRLGQFKESVAKFLEGFKYGIKYENMEMTLRRERKETPPWLQREFREVLLRLWSGIEGKIPAIVIMIDEAEVLESIQGGLMFLREVFSRLGEEKCRYQIILCGKLSFQDKMSEKFSPLTRFFHPEELSLLSEEETALLLRTELNKAGVNISDSTTHDIFTISEGHPYVVTSLGYVAYENLPQETGIIEEKHLKIFSKEIDGYLNAEFFGRLFNNASPLEKKILFAIAKAGGRAAFSDIEKTGGMKKGSISPALSALVEAGAVEKKERGYYSLFHHLFRDYLLKRIE
jgi:DNA-binding transcriptional ArsR family regulator